MKKVDSANGRKTLAKMLVILGSSLSFAAAALAEDAPSLEAGFNMPPPAARPRVWWHWMNGNITEEGITLDLEWMKRVGIGGVQNFDAQLFTPQVVEKRLSYMTPEWQKAFRYATKLSDTLGLEFAIASSPGWSETGGPWVRPAQGMKKFVWSETIVTGPVHAILASPPTETGPFQDLPSVEDLVANGGSASNPHHYADSAVVAYRMPDKDLPVGRYSTSGGSADGALLTDGRLSKWLEIPAATTSTPSWIRTDFATPQTIRSATLGIKISVSLQGNAIPAAHLEGSTDGIAFHEIAAFPQDTLEQHTIDFAPVQVRALRVRFDPFTPGTGLTRLGSVPGAAIISLGAPADRKVVRVSELTFSGDAKVNRFEEKAGFGIANDYYALQTDSNLPGRVVAQSDIVDLTGKMAPDGRLDWTPPKGRWKILRFGYSLTGKRNHPATVEATGLEVDKLDGAAVKDYINTYLDTFANMVGPDLMGKHGIGALLNDSIEVGAMNWTGDMIAQFRKLRGYDPVPWMPALTGVIIGSPAQSDAFLYDFRRTIADLIAQNHYGVIGDQVRARGLIHYSEALENGRAILGDDMDMRRHADIPMGAMWAYPLGSDPRTTYQADIRGAASVAHIYGQNLVAAESLTAAFSPWAFAPSDLKPMIDMEFALGVNRPVIHTSVHQPIEKKPGLSLAIFGQYFNRNDTWAEQAKPWVDYMSRSAYLLQQGHFVADIAYFYGEEAPLTGLFVNKPITDIPDGYGFDFMNVDALLNRVTVDGDDLVTASGARYRVLYLGGTSSRMTLPVLRKLASLVDAGATIIGARPTGSPSLSDDATEFAKLADNLWDAQAKRRGRVIASSDLSAAMRDNGFARDFDYIKPQSDSRLMFVHRALKDGDIYFLTNRQARQEHIEASFRITGKRPEIWRATTGKSEPVSYRIEQGRTIIPLDMTANDAFFLVFRSPATQSAAVVPTPVTDGAPVQIGKSWHVSFQPDRGAPASTDLTSLVPLSDSPEAGIKYFSGTASYQTTFRVARLPKAGKALWLDLGKVGDLAEILVNGRSLGIAWHAPFKIDVTNAVRAGENKLEIRVTNCWVNRLIGDAQSNAQKISFTTLPTYQPDAPLRPSGLIGPVTLSTASR